jgi:hypothetical protein
LAIPRTTPFDVSTSKNNGPFMRADPTDGAVFGRLPAACPNALAALPPPTAATPARLVFNI